MSAATWLAIAILGGAGAVLRVLATAWLGGGRPGTLVVNLSGTVALGILVGAGVGGTALALAGTGLLGAYTTFSTWMLETDERPGAAALLVPLAAGLAAAVLGRLIGALA